VRGFLVAYDALTGSLKWRFWTIPGPGAFGSAQLAGRSYLHGGGHNVDAGHLRSQTRHRFTGQPATPRPILWEIPVPGTTFIQPGLSAQPRHWSVEMVFPVHTSRLV